MASPGGSATSTPRGAGSRARMARISVATTPTNTSAHARPAWDFSGRLPCPPDLGGRTASPMTVLPRRGLEGTQTLLFLHHRKERRHERRLELGAGTVADLGQGDAGVQRVPIRPGRSHGG